ncbi:MAG: 2TM domain-containing protein [SAR202 cluster bacterium]|nr:2TM domain-containing protein [SAR202 cluster bacterium]
MNKQQVQELARYITIRKEVERKRSNRSFMYHLIAYTAANGFLSGWNALTFFLLDDETLWFFLPLLFWGVALLIHYVNAVVLFDEWWNNDERRIASGSKG